MQHIITDFDGVIGNTATMNWTLIQALHRDVKHEEYVIDHHMGNVYENPVVPFTPETTAEYFRLYNERIAVTHIADAVPAIHTLGTDFNLHIVTSNCEYAIRRVLSEASVEKYFGYILGQEAHASKVEKFQTLLQTLNLSPVETLYITDTVGDLKEAAKVDLRTIATTFGYHPEELLAQHNPTCLASNWDEVIDQVHDLMRT